MYPSRYDPFRYVSMYPFRYVSIQICIHGSFKHAERKKSHARHYLQVYLQRPEIRLPILRYKQLYIDLQASEQGRGGGRTFGLMQNDVYWVQVAAGAADYDTLRVSRLTTTLWRRHIDNEETVIDSRRLPKNHSSLLTFNLNCRSKLETIYRKSRRPSDFKNLKKAIDYCS